MISLGHAKLLGAGGEARIYQLPDDPSLVAKIWHKPTDERGAKIHAMVANPPTDPTAAQRHTSIAWPVDILQSPGANPRAMGFLMPHVAAVKPVIEFFNPKSRRQNCPLFNYFYLHRTARNLAIAVRALHERNYVIGDLNESNVLAAQTALVTVVDTDSFQVWDANKGIIYRCRVGKPEFTPPEMQGKTFSEVNRAPQQDLFGLGVIIFQLLMEGTHPFAGSYTGQGEAPNYEERILAGHFPYGPNEGRVPYKPKSIAPPFELLHPALQNLFIRCFVDGHMDPRLRPDTTAWQFGLEEAENCLVTCLDNEQHQYGGHLSACPWCARTKLLGGRDPFPTVKSVRAGTHIGPAVAPPKSLHRTTAPRRNAMRVPASTPVGQPPIPRRVPVSQSASAPNTAKPRPFAGFPAPRNDWAWIGLFFAVASIITIRMPGLPIIFGMLGGLCGIYGEVQSHGWYLDGKGRWTARSALIISALGIWIGAKYG